MLSRGPSNRGNGAHQGPSGVPARAGPSASDPSLRLMPPLATASSVNSSERQQLRRQRHCHSLRQPGGLAQSGGEKSADAGQHQRGRHQAEAGHRAEFFERVGGAQQRGAEGSPEARATADRRGERQRQLLQRCQPAAQRQQQRSAEGGGGRFGAHAQPGEMGEGQQGQAGQLMAQRQGGQGALPLGVVAGGLQRQHTGEATAAPRRQRPPGQQHEQQRGQRRGGYQQGLQRPVAPEGPEPLQPEAQLREPLIGKFGQADQHPGQQQA